MGKGIVNQLSNSNRLPKSMCIQKPNNKNTNYCSYTIVRRCKKRGVGGRDNWTLGHKASNYYNPVGSTIRIKVGLLAVLLEVSKGAGIARW